MQQWTCAQIFHPSLDSGLRSSCGQVFSNGIKLRKRGFVNLTWSIFSFPFRIFLRQVRDSLSNNVRRKESRAGRRPPITSVAYPSELEILCFIGPRDPGKWQMSLQQTKVDLVIRDEQEKLSSFWISAPFMVSWEEDPLTETVWIQFALVWRGCATDSQ